MRISARHELSDGLARNSTSVASQVPSVRMLLRLGRQYPIRLERENELIGAKGVV